MTALPPPLDSPQERRRGWSAIIVLIVLGVAVYANSLRGPFVFDDIPSILENSSIRNLTAWRDVMFPPDSQVSVGGRPLLNLSFALNYAVSGYAPWSYHVFNGLIHLGAGLCLFGFLRRTLRQPGLSARFGPQATWLAGGIAAWWLVHPLQTQAVTYVVQRGESLMGFFFLFTCYAFARAADSVSRIWLGASAFACAFGIATKEVMVVAPVLIGLYDRTFIAGSWRAAWERRRSYYSALALSALVLVTLVLAAGGNRAGSKGLGLGVPIWAWELTQFEALAHYLRLSFWPYPLVFEYGTTWAGPLSHLLPCVLLVLTLAAGTLLAVVKRWPAGFAGAWFFCILAPSSLPPGPSQMIVEHRMYLPLAAVLAVTGLVVHAWRPRVATVSGVAVILLFGALTIARNNDYRSAIALWSDTVRRRPDNARAHGNLAQALVEADRAGEAREHYAAAFRLQPDEARYPYNLAVLLVAAGRASEAIEWYRAALRLAPDDAKIQHNLAVAYAATGDLKRAVVHATVAVHLQPDNPELRYNRAYYLFGLQRAAEAVAEYEAALRLQPDYAAAHTNLANVLLQLGRPAEAVAHYAAAARLTPDSAEAQGNLAVVLLRLGRTTEAREPIAKVIVLAPGNAVLMFRLGRVALQLAHPAEALPLLAATAKAQPTAVEPRIYLAEAQYKAGDFPGAMASYEEVLRLDPRNEIARANLATLQMKKK